MAFNLNAIKEIYDNNPFAFCCVKVIKNQNDLIDVLFEYINSAYAELQHLNINDILGKSVFINFTSQINMWTTVFSDVAFGGKHITKSGYDKTVDKYLQLEIYQISFGYCGCHISEIEEQKKTEEALQIVKEKFQIAAKNSDIDFWIYNYDNQTICQTKYFEDNSYSNIISVENAPDSLIDKGIIRIDSKSTYINMYNKLKSGSKSETGDIWIYNSSKEMWKCERITFTNVMDNKNNPVRAYGIGRDVTNEVQEKIERAKLDIALSNSKLYIWEYDIVGRKSIQQEKAINEYSVTKIIENAPESIVESGVIHKDSIDEYLRMHKEVSEGQKTSEAEICFINPDKSEHWMSCNFTTIFANGLPVSAIGCAINIDSRKELETHFKEEMRNIESALSENLIVKVLSNISKNVVESYISNENVGVTSNGMPYEDGAEQLALTGYTEEERNKIRYYLNRERVLEAYSNGDTSYSIDYRRVRHDGSVIWVNTSVRTYQNPKTKDIMSFMYSYNINEEKIKDDMLQKITVLEYDFILFIDLKDDKMRLFNAHNEKSTLTSIEVENCEEQLRKNAEKTIIKDDLDRIKKFLLPDNMKQNLSKNQVVSDSFGVKGENNTTLHKRVQYAYLSDEMEQIILTCTDITNIINAQEQQQDALKTALLAAKQASSAKSDFLSRMSHEIRTPMNAIIGMSAIAAQSIGNNEQVEDCISKIGISSRFLLSLINDILDMSRIESGKMLLKNEQILCEDLFHDIDTICYTQAEAKDIDFECIVENSVEECYMGDFMKLQQVLINIISNAIKFTPPKGRVTFRARQTAINDSRAILRFIINDTGCGISEEFIPHLFEAFSQENSSTTTTYGGTGLGLAICKNLVDMMDGDINVRSIIGAGTEFTVDVKLGITEQSKINYTKNIDINFASLNVLVVDDDVSVCEQAVVTLKEIGVKSEWVDSGKKAIDRVKEELSKRKYYDIIMIDWKMPDMDGIATTREIRKIVGPDVTIIIMTAYDWASLEYEAKLAGVNMMMTKPMFKSTILSAFQKCFNKQVKIEPIPINDMTFDGKKILLAEDHPLNVEVAKKLLERKGFVIDHAENGLRALEMFTIAPEYYYDAILMDIRMPHMDGLQASNAIRHLKRKDAKTVPIIAMTANAFEEDIEKSQKAGMNAHLAKPIEPQKLYQTLFQQIYTKE